MSQTSEREQLLALMKKAKKLNRPNTVAFIKALLNEKSPITSGTF